MLCNSVPFSVMEAGTEATRLDPDLFPRGRDIPTLQDWVSRKAERDSFCNVSLILCAVIAEVFYLLLENFLYVLSISI